MAQALSGAGGTPSRGRDDFTTLFVLEALVAQGLLSPQQAQEVLARESAARARVLKAQGGNGKEAARYDVSPVEVVAIFQVPLANGRGTLDEDRVTEVAARAAGIAYRKIDPLKLDMAMATRRILEILSTMWTGRRMVLDWFARARLMLCLIHQAA